MRDIYVESVHAIKTVSGIHSLIKYNAGFIIIYEIHVVTWKQIRYNRCMEYAYMYISREVLTSKLFLHSLHFISF